MGIFILRIGFCRLVGFLLLVSFLPGGGFIRSLFGICSRIVRGLCFWQKDVFGLFFGVEFLGEEGEIDFAVGSVLPEMGMLLE